MRHPQLLHLVITALFISAGTVSEGKRSKEASKPDFTSIARYANVLRPGEPNPVWQTPFRVLTVEFLHALPGDMALVALGTTDGKGRPLHGPLVLYDSTSGAERWRYERKALIDVHYCIITSDPVIILEESQDTTSTYRGLDPESGAMLWQVNGDSRDEAYPFVDLGLFLLVSCDTTTTVVRAFDMGSGKPRWETTNKAIVQAEAPGVEVINDKLWVIGESIAVHDPSTGSQELLISDIGPPSCTSLVQLPQPALVIGTLNNSVFLIAEDGSRLWSMTTPSTPTSITPCTGMLAVAYGAAEDPNHGVILVSAKDGKALWQRKLDAHVRSHLIVDENHVIFTTQTNTGIALFVLSTSDGSEVASSLVVSLPEHARKPAMEILVPFPDHIVVCQENFVGAYRLSDLAPLWEHEIPGAIETSDAVVETVLYNLDMEDSAKQDLTQSISHVFAAQAQQFDPGLFHDIPNQSATIPQGQGLAAPGYSYTNQQARVQLNRLSERGMISEGQFASMLRQQASFETRMAAANVLSASISIALSVRESMNAAVDEAIGYVKRKLLPLQISSALRALRDSVSGKYYLRPFASCSGVCESNPARWGFLLVDLETGAWQEITTSPYEFTHSILKLNLFPTTLTPNGRLVLTRGTGLDPTRWTTMTHLGNELSQYPSFSLLAYDLSSIKLRPAEEYRLRRKLIFGAPFSPSAAIKTISINRTGLEDITTKLGSPFEVIDAFGSKWAKWVYSVEIGGTVYSRTLTVDLNKKDVVIKATADCYPRTLEFSDDFSHSQWLCKIPDGEPIPLEQLPLEQ